MNLTKKSTIKLLLSHALVYDLGFIRDKEEFMRDIENNNGVKVIIVKH